MESGWIINYKNGNSIIVSESIFKIHDSNKNKDDVESEKHWFSIEAAKIKYPSLKVYE